MGKVGFSSIDLGGKAFSSVVNKEDKCAKANKPRSIGSCTGPCLSVPAESETVHQLLEYLNDSYDDLLRDSRTSTITDDGAEIESAVQPRDSTRIRYCQNRATFIVRYKDVKGSVHSVCKGLAVTRVDHLGEKLSPCMYRAAKGAALCRARKVWNELDKSGKERYAW